MIINIKEPIQEAIETDQTPFDVVDENIWSIRRENFYYLKPELWAQDFKNWCLISGRDEPLDLWEKNLRRSNYEKRR